MFVKKNLFSDTPLLLKCSKYFESLVFSNGDQRPNNVAGNYEYTSCLEGEKNVSGYFRDKIKMTHDSIIV